MERSAIIPIVVTIGCLVCLGLNGCVVQGVGPGPGESLVFVQLAVPGEGVGGGQGDYLPLANELSLYLTVSAEDMENPVTLAKNFKSFTPADLLITLTVPSGLARRFTGIAFLRNEEAAGGFKAYATTEKVTADLPDRGEADVDLTLTKLSVGAVSVTVEGGGDGLTLKFLEKNSGMAIPALACPGGCVYDALPYNMTFIPELFDQQGQGKSYPSSAVMVSSQVPEARINLVW